jgi:hypothetical protein
VDAPAPRRSVRQQLEMSSDVNHTTCPLDDMNNTGRVTGAGLRTSPWPISGDGDLRSLAVLTAAATGSGTMVGTQRG